MARAKWAEDLIAAWYERNGYVIVARNWRCPRGELDVVAWRDGVLVICEVKARRNADFGDPFESITPQKMLRVRRATASLVSQLRAQSANRNLIADDVENPTRSSALCRERPGSASFLVRFDAAAVLGAQVEVREGVF
jgi:Holliday junction resolvase-like predicted endonuclease